MENPAAMPSLLPSTTVADPRSGALHGATGRYEKRFSDLRGLFLDEAALAHRIEETNDAVAYAVEEFRPSERAGDLIFGVSTLQAGQIGREFAMTRGHLHARSDRPEIYYCQSGHGLMLMEQVDGTVEIAEMRPQSIVYVAPHWIHRSVNVADEPLVTVFCYPADAGQDYDIIARAGGMHVLIVPDRQGGWQQEPNPRYRLRTTTP